ncbi:hypothetical protein Scep_022278 [Stephania cephalantha]|uniref:Uncharacterized protein n=1 Tax=Stephania cephalantha TaxID=152367 RepID=A0AAP0I2J5_9MAGN
MSGLFQAYKEGTELQRELKMLEKQSVLSNMCAESVNEAVQLLQENFPPDMFQDHKKLKELCKDHQEISLVSGCIAPRMGLGAFGAE